MMLTEKELREEIELIQDKISTFKQKIQPYQKMEDDFMQMLREREGKTYAEPSISVRIVIQQKSTYEAQIKRWELELKVYKRVLEGKRMDKLQ